MLLWPKIVSKHTWRSALISGSCRSITREPGESSVRPSRQMSSPTSSFPSLSVSLYLCLCLSLCLSISVSVCLSVSLSLSLSVSLSISVSLCLCVCVSVCVSVCLYLSLSLSSVSSFPSEPEVSGSNCPAAITSSDTPPRSLRHHHQALPLSFANKPFHPSSAYKFPRRSHGGLLTA